MQLVLAMLAFAVVLGLTVRSLGLRVYLSLFVFASIVSFVYTVFYYRLFF